MNNRFIRHAAITCILILTATISFPVHAAGTDQTPPEHQGDWTPVLIAPEDPISAGGAYQEVIGAAWSHPLKLQGKLNNPLVEVTPFTFNDEFYLLENWQAHWGLEGSGNGERFQDDQIRIRKIDPQVLPDLDKGEIVSVPLTGHGLGMAFVWEDRVYVFAGNWGEEAKWRIREITMTSSGDLKTWTEPVTVLTCNPDERYFNVSVCRARDQFVMLVESNDPKWPAFTFKYFTSGNLTDWQPVEGGLYGVHKYVGGPALYYYGDTYYTLYLQALDGGFYETRVTRSKDLVHWQDAPEERPFVTFNPENKVHAIRPPEIRETNASDAEICEYRGTTYVFYTGGDQHVAGDLQWATYEGAPQSLLESFYEQPRLYVPNRAQLDYQGNQLGAFVHFGLAGYAGGDFMQTPEVSLFNPQELDAEQWVLTAKTFGAKHIVLTAKHHSGFCLWPTKTTDYSVKSAPWKQGQGDVVRELADACKKHDMQLGLYLSGGDKHFPCTSTPDPVGKRKIVGDRDAYFPYFLEQLRELLTGYGQLAVVWFDGAYDPFGWDVKSQDGKPLGSAYGDAICAMVRNLQPNAAVFSGTRPDIRWSGSEQGWAPYPIWNVIHRGEGVPLWAPPYIQGWVGAEASVHTRSGWFWKPDTDATLKSVPELLNMYHNSIGRGANLLVNMTPDTRGLIPEAEVERLRSFGQALQQRFGQPLAETDSEDRWLEGNRLLLKLDQPTAVTDILIEENIATGQRVQTFKVEALVDGKWTALAEGESIGRRFIQRIDPVETDTVRLHVIKTLPLPEIQRFAIFASK